MGQDRKHPTNCEKATQEACRCKHCTGTQHGWVDALQMVKSSTPEALRNFERDADRHWRQERQKRDAYRRKQPKANLREKKAAVDTTRANLVRHLWEELQQGERQGIRGANAAPQDESQLAEAGEPGTAQEAREPGQQPEPERASSTHRGGDLESDPAATDRALTDDTKPARQVEALGCLFKQVLEHVEEDVGPLRPETRWAMADHFWCELLVQLVVVIEESNRLLSSVPDKVAREIIKSRRANRLAKIQRKVVVASARQVWKRLSDAVGLTAISDAKALLPVLRILAILMCKSPSRHTAVVTHCVDPLKNVLFHETKKRLRQVFGELTPEIATDLGDDDPLT